MGICVKSLNCHVICKHLLLEFGLSLVFDPVFSFIPGQTKLETLTFRRLLNIVNPPTGTLLRLEINFRFYFVNYLCCKLCTNCPICLTFGGPLLPAIAFVYLGRDCNFFSVTLIFSNCPGSLYCMNVSHAGWRWHEVMIEDSCTARSV